MGSVGVRSATSASVVGLRTRIYADTIGCASRYANSRWYELYRVLSRKFAAACDVACLYTLYYTWGRICRHLGTIILVFGFLAGLVEQKGDVIAPFLYTKALAPL